jgi:hypothetical protein
MLALNTVAAGVQVFFSSKGGCTEAAVEKIGKAKFTTRVQAYSFTSTQSPRHWLALPNVALKVQVILD